MRDGLGRLGRVVAAVLAMSAGAASAETVLRVKPSGDVKTMDPTISSDSLTRNVGYMLYDTLFAVDDHLVVRPQMVADWSVSADGMSYRFTLRDGLAFSDGAPVTSRDVIASLERWSKFDAMGQMLVAHGAAWTAEGDKSFTLTLKQPWGLVLDALGKAGAPVPFILPARVIAATPAGEAVKDPTGSGPFVFRTAEWVPGSKLVFERNARYLPRAEPASGLAGGKVVHFDRVELLIMPEAQTALDALRRGELDIAEDIPADLAASARQGRGITVSHQDEIGVAQQMRLNSIQKPFSDARVRQAALLAIDPAEMLDAMVGGDRSLGQVCRSFYVCASPVFTTAGFPAPDPAKARALLREAGYDGTPVVILDAAENAQIHPASLVAKQELEQAGFTVDVQALDWASVVSRRASKEPVGKGGWSVFISGPGGLDMMVPTSHLGLRANCEKAWFGWPCDERMEQLRAAYGDATDETARQAIARDLQLRADEVVPYVPVGVAFQLRAARSELAGLLTPPAPVYWGVERR